MFACRSLSARIHRANTALPIGYNARVSLPHPAIIQVSQIHSDSTTPTTPSIKSLPEYGKYAEETWSDSLVQSITDSSFVQSIESALVVVHDTTGLPWWLTIAATTVGLRLLITTPLMVYSMLNNLKMTPFNEALGIQHPELIKTLRLESKKHSWDDRTMRYQYVANMRRQRKELKETLKPPHFLQRFGLPFVQVPLWIGLSFGLRDLTLLYQKASITPEMLSVHAELASEGLSWFHDLSVADPYFVLPLISCVSNLLVIELHGMSKVNLPLTYFLRSISLLVLPIASQLPSSVVFYWAVSSIYGLVQGLVIKTPVISKYFDPSKYSLKPYLGSEAKK